MLITAQQRSMAMKGAELIQAVASLRKNAVSYVSPGIQPRKQVRFWNEKRWTPTLRETIRMILEYTAAAFGNARIWLRVRPIANHEHKIAIKSEKSPTYGTGTYPATEEQKKAPGCRILITYKTIGGVANKYHLGTSRSKLEQKTRLWMSVYF